MATKEQVASLMAAGKSQAETATELGLTAGYISQLQSDEEYLRLYQKKVGATKLAAQETAATIDSHYDRVELKLAEFIDANSSTVLASLAQKPTTLLSTIKVINGLKRRGSGEGAQQASTNNLVAIQLPSFIINAATPEVKKNLNNEVIEVAGKPLVSLQSSAVRGQLDKLAGNSSDSLQLREAAPTLSVSKQELTKLWAEETPDLKDF